MDEQEQRGLDAKRCLARNGALDAPASRPSPSGAGHIAGGGRDSYVLLAKWVSLGT